MNQLDLALENRLVSNRTLIYPSETIRMIRLVSQNWLLRLAKVRTPTLTLNEYSMLIRTRRGVD
jgi:hypothetical protein